MPAVSGDVVIRQRLKHREDSKDSAFDGSIVSVGTNAEDDVTVIPSRAVALSNVTQSKPISLPKIESSPGAVPKTLPILEKYSFAKYLRNNFSFFFSPDIQASGCGSESKCGKRWKEPLITQQIEYSN